MRAAELTLTGGYKRLWRDWLRPHWRVLLLSFALMAVVAIASGAYAKFIQYLIQAFEGDDLGFLAWSPVLIILLTCLKGAAQYGHIVLTNKVLAQVEADLQGKMFASLIHADMARLQAEAPASLAARFSADILLVRNALKEMLTGVAAILIVVAAFAVMLSIDTPMTLGLILVFAVAFWPLNVIGSRLRVISRDTQEEIADMTGRVHEGLAAIRLVRTYRLEDRLAGSAGQAFERLRDLKVKAMNWQGRMEPLMEVVGGVALAGLLGLVGWRMSSGAASLAEFMGLLTGLAVASQPARKIGNVYALAEQGLAALHRIYALFDAKNQIADAPDAQTIEHARGEISFQDVSFDYPDGTRALSDINLKIEPGQKVAFVGRSGAGKSSIYNLLPRLFDATHGTVTLDGKDLRALTIASLRNQIAVVSQDTLLMAGTVAENIGFGSADATRDQIEAAATDAAAHGFITALPQGYDTQTGPGGAVFSGGERQRISIARAILRNAPVLMLDEPTSALDAESEAAIKAALDRLTAERTTLIIAHRLATILDADKIVVMDEGRIIDTGTHAELLARGGLYGELYALQFEGS